MYVCMYLPRRIGGRGLTKLETAYKSTTIGLETYLRNTDDALVQLVLQHETKKKLYSMQKEAEKFNKEFEVPNLKREANERITKFATTSCKKSSDTPAENRTFYKFNTSHIKYTEDTPKD